MAGGNEAKMDELMIVLHSFYQNTKLSIFSLSQRDKAFSTYQVLGF